MAIDASVINVSLAPEVAIGMVYCQGAHSIGLVLENAVLNEMLSNMTSRASVEQCLALILATGAAGAAQGE